MAAAAGAGATKARRIPRLVKPCAGPADTTTLRQFAALCRFRQSACHAAGLAAQDAITRGRSTGISLLEPLPPGSGLSLSTAVQIAERLQSPFSPDDPLLRGYLGYLARYAQIGFPGSYQAVRTVLRLVVAPAVSGKLQRFEPTYAMVVAHLRCHPL